MSNSFDPTEPASANNDLTDNLKPYTIFTQSSYAVLDSANLCASTFRFIFEIIYQNNVLATLSLHNWIISVPGIISITIFSTFLITFSLFANLFSLSKKKNEVEENVIFYWLTLRDTQKSLKNTYKGLRSFLQITQLLLTNQDLQFFTIPLGISLGILSAVNRYFYRNLEKERREVIKHNKKLLETIRSMNVDSKYIDSTDVYIYDDSKTIDFSLYKNSYFLLVKNNKASQLLFINRKGEKEKIDPGKRNIAQIHEKLKVLSHNDNYFTQESAILPIKTHLCLDKFQIRSIITAHTSSYDLSFNLPKNIIKTKKNTLYLKLVDGQIAYTLVNINGQIVNYTIPNEIFLNNGLDCSFENELNQENTKPYLDLIRKTAIGLGHYYNGHTEYQSFYHEIATETASSKNWGYLSKIYSGFIDGLYYYFGFGIITTLNPTFLIAISAISTFFLISFIGTKIYDEYRRQAEAQNSAEEIKLQICGEELIDLLYEIRLLSMLKIEYESEEKAEDPDPSSYQNPIQLQIDELVSAQKLKTHEFETYYLRLNNNIEKTWLTAIADGLTNGLAIVGAASAFLYSMISFTMVFSITINPIFILSFTCLSFVTVIGFALGHLIQHYNDEYDLELMSSLPDPQKAVKGKIYLANNGKYLVLDNNGKLKEGHFDPALIGQDDLAKKLKNKDFRSAIFTVTSKAGHTRIHSFPHPSLEELLDKELNKIKTNNTEDLVQNSEEFILDQMNFETFSSSTIALQSELARTTGSAFSKGTKFAEFFLSGLQIIEPENQIHDSPWMIGIMGLLSPVYAYLYFNYSYQDKFKSPPQPASPIKYINPPAPDLDANDAEDIDIPPYALNEAEKERPTLILINNEFEPDLNQPTTLNPNNGSNTPSSFNRSSKLPPKPFRCSENAFSFWAYYGDNPPRIDSPILPGKNLADVDENDFGPLDSSAFSRYSLQPLSLSRGVSGCST